MEYRDISVLFYVFDNAFLCTYTQLMIATPRKRMTKKYFYLRETKMHHIFHEFINCAKQALARNMQQTEVAVMDEWKLHIYHFVKNFFQDDSFLKSDWLSASKTNSVFKKTAFKNIAYNYFQNKIQTNQLNFPIWLPELL